MNRFNKVFLFLLIYFISLSLFNNALLSKSQTEQEAMLVIQEANVKLDYTISLLEKIQNYDQEVRNLVQQTDIARELIKDAEVNYDKSNFTIAYQKANSAILQLNSIIEKIENIIHNQTYKRNLLLSLIGVFAGILAIIFCFVFITRIHPWYEKKRIEEYSKLEIKYKSNKGDR